MDVSIIIVNYHSEDLISQCIKTVKDKTNDLKYEIIIVDNGSDSTGKALLDSLRNKETKVINAKDNLGFGKANNLGAEYAKGKYLFLLNPDTELMNDAIHTLFSYMETNQDTIGVCGGNLYGPNGEPTPSFCRDFDTLEKEKDSSKWSSIIMKKVKDMQNHNKHLGTDEFNYTEEPQEVAYIFGADMFMRKELFVTVGGFDRNFFMYAEEAELQKRISDLGYKIMCIPQARIIHLEGATSKSSPRQFSMRMKGKMTYFDKCFPPDGAALFYKYRRKRYKRLLEWQKLRGRKPSTTSIEILDQVYREYCRERG